ncbi:Nicotinamide/nicotinic acid mononucleotide adenylyltransferase 1 [Anabarilius grahami]|uniref:Nicotinamide/nicotinic acid mononucleotide adenylyltransferase 1 n=1 Tax=Anabarilius grahami TaxID=495550 RepID=A0A3N0YRC9_ANAGA|nr:Nicotinamide/nicotinic acid mononucleotide adenylyltransferase 1 [Anabarilius grahami]
MKHEMAAQMKAKVVLLACGSFNPITNIHMRLFELARDYLQDTGRYIVVKGIISPVGDGYKKKGLIENCHRLEMARLASENSEWITVDDWESQQPVWVETAKVLRHHHAGLISSGDSNNNGLDTVRCEKRRKMEQNRNICQIDFSFNTKGDTPQLKLLCGADVLESFAVPNLWKSEDIEEILGRYGVVCITRCGSDAEKFINQSNVLSRHRKNIHVVQEWVTNDISATHVRCALRKGHSVRYLLPDPVVRYIQNHSLFKESEQKNADDILAPLQRYTSTNYRYETTDTVREVCLEMYINSDFYCGDSFWVPDEEDVQLEADDKNVISEVVQLVSEDLTDPEWPSTQMESSSGIDQGGMDASPVTPEENRPTENTKVRKKNIISAFFQKLFGISAKPEMDLTVPEPLCVPDKSAVEPTSQTDLFVNEQSSDVNIAISELKSPTLVSEDLTDPAGPSTEVAGSSSGINQGGMDASPETPEKNSPTDVSKSTKVRRKNKIRAFFQKLFGISDASSH